MNKLLKYLLPGIYLLVSSFIVYSNESDLDKIRGRIVEEIILQKVDDAKVKSLVNSFRNDGTWPGINYQDLSRTGFEHRIHSDNIVTLARAWANPKSEFYRSDKVKQIIKLALEFWARNDFICDNWWYNQIGTPSKFVTVMLIIGDDLPDELVEDIQPVISRAHINAWGARPSGDRIKIAGIQAKNSLFIEDEKQFMELINVIESEIKLSTGRGMQYDYSFHHRDDGVNNTLSYGLGYANTFIEWAYYLRNTEYALSDTKLHQLIDYYLDGICKHLVHGKYPDLGAKNRSISRIGDLKAMGCSSVEKLMETSQYRHDELQEICNIRTGRSEPDLTHSKFFWHSEYYSHQRQDYFTSVRMFSTRNDNMEVPYNREGIKNHHLGDGANYVYLTGEEYFNIFPVFDWQKIPGTTVMQKSELPSGDEIQKDGLTDFVGGITDGRYGGAVFDFISPHDPLKAKKSWFFFDNEYLCLGAGISAEGDMPVVTTLNQSLLQSDVRVRDRNGSHKLPKGEHKIESIRWIHANGIAYVFPDEENVNLMNDQVRGSWYDINKQTRTSRETVTRDVLKIWIEHGVEPADAVYSYVVLPGVDPRNFEEYCDHDELKILSNTSELQAAKHDEMDICQAVFYRAGRLKISDELELIMDSQGMIMMRQLSDEKMKVTVSDPSRKLGKLHFSLSGKIEQSGDHVCASWNEKKGISNLSVELPQGVYAGKSVSFEIILLNEEGI
ncbi:MAG: chondroitin lyase [Bacteroidetes bacterium]|jgi:chondroitin AC lyase|nr:chondroitin lyase [Bacteroidota bacterium]